MPYNWNLKYPERWNDLTVSWFRDLLDTLYGMRIQVNRGGGIKLSDSGSGQWVDVTDLVRYQVRDAVVVTQAPAAGLSGGVRTVQWGRMKLLVPAAGSDATTSPPTLKLEPEPRDGSDVPYLPFYNSFISGPSAAAGKLIKVHRTPFGWALLLNECPADG